jgi:nondiscriminating glutamyl-tRNA synthetase
LKERTNIFINEGNLEYGSDALAWIQNPSSKNVFSSLIKAIEAEQEITLDNFKIIMSRVQKELDIKGKDLWMPVRVALTGLTAGPELPLVIEVLGKTKILRFLKQAIEA